MKKIYIDFFISIIRGVNLIITTTESVNGKEVEILGVVFGNTVRAKNIGSDIAAGLQNI
jgi:uncharacterized protein YbjQ (UPF0145 family)